GGHSCRHRHVRQHLPRPPHTRRLRLVYGWAMRGCRRVRPARFMMAPVPHRQPISERAPEENTDMERIWLKHYPAGVPADIDPNKYRSIRDLFEESVASLRDRLAYYCIVT